MGSNTVYPQGGLAVDVSVAAGESIAVYTKDVAKVYRILGYPNQPDSASLIGTVTNGQTVFGPYASGATIRINGGAADILYQVGTDPVVTEQYASRRQGDPAAVNATATVDPSDILAGIVTSTTAAAVTATLPTGTIMDAASEFAIGDSFDWTVVVTGGVNALTVAAGTAHTIVGAAVVAASTSATFRTRKTAANTFVTYRLTA